MQYQKIILKIAVYGNHKLLKTKTKMSNFYKFKSKAKNGEFLLCQKITGFFL